MVERIPVLAHHALSFAIVAGLTAASAGGARAGVIYDATGGAAQFEGADVVDPNAPGGVGVGPIVADRFLNSAASTLSSVTLNLELNGAPLTGFTVDLWPDNFGLPVFSQETKITSVSDASLTSSLALYTFTPGTSIHLAANTFYDIGIDTGTVLGDPAVTAVMWGNTVDPAVLARFPVQVGALYFHTVGGVDPNSDGPYDLIVNVSIPESSSWAMMLAGFAFLGYAGYRARRSTAAL
jgi:hypothetical protein